MMPTIGCLFTFFPLVTCILLSIRLRFTTSDHPFWNFKHFLNFQSRSIYYDCNNIDQHSNITRTSVHSNYTILCFYHRSNKYQFNIVWLDSTGNRIHAVLTMSTGPLAHEQSNFVRISKFVSFYLDIHV